MIFVEPETVQGQALKARFGSEPVSPLPEDTATQMAGPLHKSFDEQADDATLLSAATAAQWRSPLASATQANVRGLPSSCPSRFPRRDGA